MQHINVLNLKTVIIDWLIYVLNYLPQPLSSATELLVMLPGKRKSMYIECRISTGMTSPLYFCNIANL